MADKNHLCKQSEKSSHVFVLDRLTMEGKYSKYVSRFSQVWTSKKAFCNPIEKEIFSSNINQTHALEDIYKYFCCLGKQFCNDDDPVVCADQNPLLGTWIYEVEFSDRHLEEFAVNVIAECMYSQIDAEGWQQQFLPEIMDNLRGPDAVPIEDRFEASANRYQKHGEEMDYTRLGFMC